MHTFEFTSPSRILFGVGQSSRLPDLARQLGSKALIIFNTGQDLAHRLAADLPQVLLPQPGEPQVNDVDHALQTARENACDLVIGLGGGSAIDAAKAVAGLLTNGGCALDYMEVVGKGHKISRPAAPWIAIPTTAGTGAEATRNAVIGSPEHHFKASIRSEHLLPRIVLIDPQLGVDVPPHVTAASGMDALCQCIESYTSTGAQPITDALALQGIALAGRALRRAFGNGHDLDARQDMALAALLSGITLANAGLGAVHGFAAPLGANFPVPHGAACAALLPPVLQANVHALRTQSPAHPVLNKYARIGRTLVGTQDLSDNQAIDAGIEFLDRLLRDLHIPPLRQFGLTAQSVPNLVSLARKASSMRYNPVVLSDEALSAALQKAIGV
jgi:alcohol dehydrogenase class IV